MIKNFMKHIYKIIFYICEIFKLENNKIIFIEGTRENFTGNCEAIYKKIKDKSNYKFILIQLYQSKKVKFNNIKQYNFLNPISIYHIATSKYWISNEGFFNFLPKRKEQLNIQLWHGAGAFKKVGYSQEKNIKGKYEYYKEKNKTIDLLCISSETVLEIYQEIFCISKNKVKNLGIPRADIFFKKEEKEKIKEEFFKKYLFLKNKKIILYAPTFRDHNKRELQIKLNIELMKEELEKLNYILILKVHPNIKKNNLKVDNKFSFNFSEYDNVSDLLIVSDILISDYSSIIFEFSIMKKPILFYSYDVEEYIKDRGFYYNYYEFIPNKINYTTEEVIDSILNKKWDLERIEKFAKYFFNPFDGNSTERVLKEIGLLEEGDEIK